MKRSLTCLCLAGLLGLATAPAHAQAPAWSRAGRIGSFGTEAGDAIAVDAAGNTYVAGRFSSASLTIGSTTFNNADLTGTSDVFVAKYSPAGAALWATRFGGNGNDYPGALAVDAAGNVYVAGAFTGALSVGGTTLASAGTLDMFLVRVSAAGAPQWAVRAGGASNDLSRAVALDDAGFVWLGGHFQGTATVTGTANTLVSAGNFDLAFVKYDAATGAFVRMGRDGGAGADFLEGLATAGDALYAAGSFASPTLTVGTTTLTRRCANSDGFLIKYDRFRAVTWAKSEGATGATTYANFAVAANLDGTVVTGGEFQGTIVAGNFDTIVNTGASPAPMVVRYAAAGNVTSGRSSGGSLGFGRVTGLARDAAGATYAAGHFSGTVRWSFAEATSAGGTDVFVAKLPATGNASWVVRAGGSANDAASALALDAAGNGYLTGEFSGSATFGALPVLASAGGADAFVARLGGTVTATRAAQAAQPLDAWPNPVGANRVLHLTLPAAAGPATLRLFDAVGRLACALPVPAANAAALRLPAALAPGRYVAEVQAGDRTLRRALLLE